MLTPMRRGKLGWLRPYVPIPYRVNRYLNTPVERLPRMGDDTVVIYPEIVPGNPLNARHVVRWLLYNEPGYSYDFGADDMFFTVDRNFDHPVVSGGAPSLFLYKINPVYQNLGRTDRKGACYMVRKGAHKMRIPETEGAECLDGKSHEEIAEAFNRCEVFYSYDEATMYSQYAALCGCLSIVIPGNYSSRTAWVEGYSIAKYGIAYGLNDVEHARATMHLVRPLLEHREQEGVESVRAFVALTRARFGTSRPGV
ncbi:MAG: hypothetical protein U1E46_16130 [Hyphomicrobiales bacterium]